MRRKRKKSSPQAAEEILQKVMPFDEYLASHIIEYEMVEEERDALISDIKRKHLITGDF